MPSLSPPTSPARRRSPAPTLSTSTSLSQGTPAPAILTKPSNPSLRPGSAESDADARLRERSYTPTPDAFGGQRRGKGPRAGAGVGGLKRREWLILGVITGVGGFVRLYKLGWPTSVV